MTVFKFGNHSDIYNPWSITNFLKEKQISSILGIYQLKRSGKSFDQNSICRNKIYDGNTSGRRFFVEVEH